jgi:FAD/FMN-containing dehydrogenase
MSRFNKIIMIDPRAQTITVQSGITWHEIQKVIDPLNFSVQVMQSYADFSVGGSISVNVHGQDHHFGSIGKTIVSFDLLMADGTIRKCSRDENTKLFHATIGGYGLLGIILHVTLKLTDNYMLQRESYIHTKNSLFENCDELLAQPGVEFFSSRLLVDPATMYEKSLTIVYRKVDRLSIDPITDQSVLQELLEKQFFTALRTIPLVKKVRIFLGKHLVEKDGTLISRNNMMHSSIKNLQKTNRQGIDLLQEYFIPRAQCPAFLRAAAAILKKNKVDVLNTSIRYVPADTQTMLTYAPQDCYSFVLYVHIKDTQKAFSKTEQWTRELIDAALRCSGRFYLPYQHLATREQFTQAYPEWPEFIQLKKKYDPQELFSNGLYLKYAQGS